MIALQEKNAFEIGKYYALLFLSNTKASGFKRIHLNSTAQGRAVRWGSVHSSDEFRSGSMAVFCVADLCTRHAHQPKYRHQIYECNIIR